MVEVFLVFHKTRWEGEEGREHADMHPCKLRSNQTNAVLASGSAR